MPIRRRLSGGIRSLIVEAAGDGRALIRAVFEPPVPG